MAYSPGSKLNQQVKQMHKCSVRVLLHPHLDVVDVKAVGSVMG